MKKSSLLAAAVFFLTSAAVSAGGTTAAFLKLGSGARATGLGGAFTAVSGDINAISYNPAGLAGLKRSEAGFTRAELVEGVSYNFLGYSRPVAGGGMGLGVNYLGQSSIEGRGANREVTGSFQASDTAVNLATPDRLPAGPHSASTSNT
jgi:long-subunit fatty acid transport protein